MSQNKRMRDSDQPSANKQQKAEGQGGYGRYNRNDRQSLGYGRQRGGGHHGGGNHGRGSFEGARGERDQTYQAKRTH